MSSPFRPCERRGLGLTLEVIERGTKGQRPRRHTDLLPKLAWRPPTGRKKVVGVLSENRWTQSLADDCALSRKTQASAGRVIQIKRRLHLTDQWTRWILHWHA